MSTMNISLPQQMKEWVEEQPKSGKFSNSSDYVRHLIRKDQERAEKIAAMQKLVDEALASEFVETSPDEIMDRVRDSLSAE